MARATKPSKYTVRAKRAPARKASSRGSGPSNKASSRGGRPASKPASPGNRAASKGTRRPSSPNGAGSRTAGSAKLAPSRAGLRVRPCLWFDRNAEEAARFYVSVFPHSRITQVHKSPADYPSGKQGDVLMVDAVIAGQSFNLLNGGPFFRFNEAVSFIVDCPDEDLDGYYEKLSAVPEAEQCGWVKDRFGLSWQLIPEGFNKLMSSPDPTKTKRVMEAMLTMKRLDVRKLAQAAKA